MRHTAAAINRWSPKFWQSTTKSQLIKQKMPKQTFESGGCRYFKMGIVCFFVLGFFLDFQFCPFSLLSATFWSSNPWFFPWKRNACGYMYDSLVHACHGNCKWQRVEVTSSSEMPMHATVYTDIYGMWIRSNPFTPPQPKSLTKGCYI